MIFQMQKTLRGVQSTTCRVRIFFLLNLIFKLNCLSGKYKSFLYFKNYAITHLFLHLYLHYFIIIRAACTIDKRFLVGGGPERTEFVSVFNENQFNKQCCVSCWLAHIFENWILYLFIWIISTFLMATSLSTDFHLNHLLKKEKNVIEINSNTNCNMEK